MKKAELPKMEGKVVAGFDRKPPSTGLDVGLFSSATQCAQRRDVAYPMMDPNDHESGRNENARP